MPELQELAKMKLNIKSLNYSTILTIWLIVVLTIWGELSNSFKTFLAVSTGHHWITKGMLSLIFFVVVYFMISKIVKDRADSTNWAINTSIATILAVIIIFGFYLWHFVP